MPRAVTRYIRKIRRAKGSRENRGAAVGQSDNTPENAVVSIQLSPASCVAGDNNVAVKKNAAFEEAWKNHWKELTEHEKKNGWREGNQHISLDAIHEKIVNLDTKHAIAVSRKVIDPTLHFLEAINSLVQGATTAAQSSPIGSIVMGVVRVIIDAAIKAGKYFEKLSHMLGRLPDYFDVLQRYADISASSPDVHKFLVASYSNILAFFRKAYVVFVNKEGTERSIGYWFASARIFVNSQWSSFEQEYGKILSDFEHCNQMLRDMALVENFNYNKKRQQAIEAKKKIKKGMSIQIEKRYTGANSSGIGKSVLSSIVIDHLSKITLTEETAVAFWYCKYHDTSMETMAYRLVRTAIKQLCQKMSRIPSDILDFYHAAMKHGQAFLLDDCIELFFICTRYFNRAFLAIDGLDECNGKQCKLILNFIQQLSRSNVKVFLTSRWMRDIEKLCANNAMVFPITAWEVKDDISIFVKHQVPEKLSIHSAETRQRVINTLIEKSEGLFLWVELQLEDLSQVPECDLEEQLQYLPKDLDSMYIRMVSNIKALPRASSSLARRCILWVTYAKHLLTGSELKELVSFMASPSKSSHHGDSLSCSSHKHYSSEDITNTCFGLLQMDIDSEPVRPVHFSMQEVFSNPTLVKFPDDCRDFVLSPEQANVQLAVTCIRILLSEDSCWDDARRYCARYFENHILGLPTIPQELDNMVDSLLSADHEVFANILALRYPYRLECCMGSPRKIEPSFFVRCTGLDRVPRIASRYPKVILSDRPEEYLQLSCYLGMSDVLEAIIETGADLNYRDQVGYTALDCACLAKQHDIIKRLLDTGVLQRCNPSGPSSPVARAAKIRDFKSVELLIKGGLNITLTDYIQAIETDDTGMVELIVKEYGENIQQDYENATFRAIDKGFHNILRFLINGFDSNALQPILCYALSISDNKDIRNLALQYKPDWSFCLKMDARMLKTASFCGDIEVMNSLIENGADVNGPRDSRGSPLQVATHHGHVRAMELLIEKGADINLLSGEKGTMLEIATSPFSSIEAMRLLISKNAPINEGSSRSGGPLGIAAHGRAIDKMELLLSNGADINAPLGEWGSPLGTAVAKGKLESVEYLVAKGADVNISCPRYGCLLGLAAYYENLDIMRVLIDNGADINRNCGEYGCPLGAAAYRGKIRAMKLLLDGGAVVNTSGGFYGSPLGAAALEDNVEAMDLLFQRGADVNIQGGPFGTTLGTAAFGCAIRVIRPRYTKGLELLLEKGADVYASGGLFRNALEVALFSCHSDAIRIFSAKGINIEPPCPLSREYSTTVEMARSVEVRKWFLPKQKEIDELKEHLRQ
ncbi:conserved hypothetical protein [Paecilomyces variotii No. 5]|uniref:Nephrocystin 3-like N-terminal domain-containing protein n=1 Tax=Byssochlamys spectabilis (strain No. 5 / NBRC 109023) TaxID=1356009 RepID=V5FB64_BYSSN|nr:conserved hypothetical protein [Paecilomyces variotii No. 5]